MKAIMKTGPLGQVVIPQEFRHAMDIYPGSNFQGKWEIALGHNNRSGDRYKYKYIMINSYNLSEIVLLKGKGRITAPASSFKALIGSKAANDSQFPLSLKK